MIVHDLSSDLEDYFRYQTSLDAVLQPLINMKSCVDYHVNCLWHIRLPTFNKNFVLSVLPERNYVTFGSLLSLSPDFSVTFVRPAQGEISSPLCTLAIVWPCKLYEDRPGGNPPSEALNTRGVAK